MKLKCDCGCGGEAHLNRMVPLELQAGVDGTKKRIRTVKRFYVLPDCREDFENEMVISHKLEQFSRACYKLPMWRRALRAQEVVRMMHAIHQRKLGFEAARKKALRSGFLFSIPKPMAAFLSEFWMTEPPVKFRRFVWKKMFKKAA
jgi:hypothetical protein